MDDIEQLRASLTPEELAAVHERRVQAEKPTFTRSQISDVPFFTKNKAAIFEAAREGRILDDRRRTAAPRPATPAEKPTFTRTQLADPAFFVANRREIGAAVREGRVTDDKSDWRITGKGTAR